MDLKSFRQETRQERHKKKKSNAITYPISIATINFCCDENVGYVIRSAGCFGCKTVHIIGSMPEHSFLRAKSGTLIDHVNVIQHSNPHSLIDFARKNNINLVSAELHERSVPIEEFVYDFSKETCIVLGNENFGVPEEIIHNSDIVKIPMRGVGYCLNTAQTGNILLFDYIQRYEAFHKQIIARAS